MGNVATHMNNAALFMCHGALIMWKGPFHMNNAAIFM
jgi:hypothetical protein